MAWRCSDGGYGGNSRHRAGAVIAAPAVCHMMRAKQEEEERQASKNNAHPADLLYPDSTDKEEDE